MTGRSKGKFFCWADVDVQRCTKLECQKLSYVADAPAKCPDCGTPLPYKCRRKMFPDVPCPEHHALPKGPSAFNPAPKPEPETIAQSVAMRMPPEARKVFGKFLHETAPADLLRLLATRLAAKTLHKSARGLFTDEQELEALKSVAFMLDKEQNVRLVSRELNPPKLEDAGAFDYRRLSPDQLKQLDDLLALAAVDPQQHAPAALTAALKSKGKRKPRNATALEAWHGTLPDEDAVPARRGKRRSRARKRS